MKKILASCFGIVALLLIGGLGMQDSAYGLTCASGASCTEDLTTNNVSGLNIDVSVTVDNTVAGKTTITVTYLSSSVTNSVKGISEFAYGSDVNATAASLTAIGYTQGLINSNNQMDGFGNFVNGISDNGGGLSSFTFVLASQVTDFTNPNSTDNAEFAVHVQFNGSCSGFVSDGTAIDQKSPESTCNVVPEPGTVLLVGTLLSGLGFFGRKKFTDILKG